MIHLQVCNYVTGQRKKKAGLRQTRVYYPFASTHMVNTQLQRVQNVHTKYRKYFRGFLNSRLLNFARNSRKLMYREYFRFYSTVSYFLILNTSLNFQVSYSNESIIHRGKKYKNKTYIIHVVSKPQNGQNTDYRYQYREEMYLT